MAEILLCQRGKVGIPLISSLFLLFPSRSSSRSLSKDGSRQEIAQNCPHIKQSLLKRKQRIFLNSKNYFLAELVAIEGYFTLSL